MRFALLVVMAAVGCSNEIGDSCALSSDCSPNGDRICDNSSPGGYCTVLGCDFDTCPGEAVCVRFYSVGPTGKPCEQSTEDISTDDCSPDERCALNGYCVPRSAEIRYCMKTCGGDGDCRDEYECRDQELMISHGGEPVTAPGVSEDPQAFCAPAPLDTTN